MVNWSTSYTGIKHVTLVAGINNLFDRMPPATNSSLYSYGYLSSAASPIGRTWVGSLTYKF